MGLHIWHVCSLCYDLFDGTIAFEHVTLTVTFDLHLKTYSITHNFTTRHRGPTLVSNFGAVEGAFFLSKQPALL